MGGSMNFTKCQVKANVILEAYKDMGDVDGIADPTFKLALNFSDLLADGRGADSADLAYCWSGAIVAGGNVDVALEGGSDKTPFGDALSFDRIKAIILVNTGATQLRIGDRPANAFGSWIVPATASKPVGPGGLFIDYRPDVDGYPVTAGDVLRIHNDSGAAAGSFKLLIVGEETDVSSSSSGSSSTNSSSSTSTSTSSASASSVSASSVSASASSLSASSVSASSASSISASLSSASSESSSSS